MPIIEGETLVAPRPVDQGPADPFRVIRDSRPSGAFATLARRPQAGRVEVDDLAYHFGSAVTLPFQRSASTIVVSGPELAWEDPAWAKAYRESAPEQYEQWSAYRKENAATRLVAPALDRLSLTVAAIAILLFADGKNDDLRLLVAGHSARDEDELGPDLAVMRSRNFRALITGDRDGFAASCDAFHVLDDLRPIGHFLGHFFGFAFRSTSVDDEELSAADFRAAYNGRVGSAPYAGYFQEKLTESGRITTADWGALFDCYSLMLAAMVGASTAEELATARGRVKFVGAGSEGYASAIPRAQGTEWRSTSDRRLEVLGFPSAAAESVVADLDTAYIGYDLVPFDPKWFLELPSVVDLGEPTLRIEDVDEKTVIEATLPVRPHGLAYIRTLLRNRPSWPGNDVAEEE